MAEEKGRQIIKAVNDLREIYRELIRGDYSKEEYIQVMEEILKYQKEDGAFTGIDDYHVESDMRVDLIYFPTYYGTAALVFMDNVMNFSKKSMAFRALLKGLRFSVRRKLAGHGYEAEEECMRAMEIFENAGIYRWFIRHPEEAPEFQQMWERLAARSKSIR